MSVTGRSPNLNRAMMAEAQKYPGQEQAVLEYFRSHPEAMETVSAPLFEEKVVDFIVEMAAVTDKSVSVEELMRDPDEEVDAAADKPKAKAKKPAAKKPAAKKSAKKADEAAGDAAEDKG